MDKTIYLTLKPSSIEGVGVFTAIDFSEGEMIPVWRDGDYRQIVNPTGRELLMCQNYCIQEGDVYHCPLTFIGMSIGWYLNHADKPNATMIDDICYAVRKIDAGEEITIDYSVIYYK